MRRAMTQFSMNRRAKSMIGWISELFLAIRAGLDGFSCSAFAPCLHRDRKVSCSVRNGVYVCANGFGWRLVLPALRLALIQPTFRQHALAVSRRQARVR